jgi:hypothetical protein
MKIFHAIDATSSIVSKETKEKMAILDLVDVGKYVEDVGIRDGQFYIIPEDESDKIYLGYRQAMHNINVAFTKKIDLRLINQKTTEFNYKKANAMKRFMEMPK